MAYVHYEDLNVYRLAYALALEIHNASLKLPKMEQFGGIADQMRRASRSVCANIAEGLSKGGSALEEARFLSIALGSCEEMRVWSSFGRDFGYWDDTRAQQWRNSYDEVAKMVYSLKEKRLAA